MKRPTVFQLNLLVQFPRDGGYISGLKIHRPNGYSATNQEIRRLCLKGYVTEHPSTLWMFRLTDEMISYLNGVKIK